MTKEEALQLLKLAGIFYPEDPEDAPEMKQLINLNDTFYWACADCEKVNDEELVEVAMLFCQYGMCGIYYWVVKKRGWTDPVEFLDINRMIEFVKHEEELAALEPNTDKRAYMKYTYKLGE